MKIHSDRKEDTVEIKGKNRSSSYPPLNKEKLNAPQVNLVNDPRLGEAGEE